MRRMLQLRRLSRRLFLVLVLFPTLVFPDGRSDVAKSGDFRDQNDIEEFIVEEEIPDPDCSGQDHECILVVTRVRWPDYGTSGWIGDVRDAAGAIHETFDQAFTPKCGVPFVLEQAESVRVRSCATAAPNYTQMCGRLVPQLRPRCKAQCAKLPECSNWQLQPWYYKEWGCLGGGAAPGPTAVPHALCREYWGCVCTPEEG